MIDGIIVEAAIWVLSWTLPRHATPLDPRPHPTNFPPHLLYKVFQLKKGQAGKSNTCVVLSLYLPVHTPPRARGGSNGGGGGGHDCGGGGDHRGRGAVRPRGGSVPLPARRPEPDPGARRLRGIAVVETRLRPPPPPPRQEVLRAAALATPRRGPHLPSPRRLRPLPRRLRRAVRAPHAPPPRGPVGPVRRGEGAVGGRRRGPRHGPGREVHGEVPRGRVRRERREVRARGARAGGVPGHGDACCRVQVGQGDERQSRARCRVRQLRHGDRLRPGRRRRLHLHRRPWRASPGDQGDLERGHGAPRVPRPGVDHRQAGVAHVRRRVRRRHRPARPLPPRRGSLHHEAHHPGLPRLRRRCLRQDQDRRDPGAPRRRQERPWQRRRVRRREAPPFRCHRLRHRVPEHRQALAQEQGRADRRRRHGGKELPGALEGRERPLRRGDGAEGHLWQRRRRRAHRRRHQQAASPPAGQGQRHQLQVVKVC